MADAPARRAEKSDDSAASSIQQASEGGKEKTDGTQALTLAAMHAITADIKTTLTAAIADEVRGLTHRLDEVVKAGDKRDKSIKNLEKTSELFRTHRITLNRQVEDLDNRGRRHNIRVRGLSESIPTD